MAHSRWHSSRCSSWLQLPWPLPFPLLRVRKQELPLLYCCCCCCSLRCCAVVACLCCWTEVPPRTLMPASTQSHRTISECSLIPAPGRVIYAAYAHPPDPTLCLT